VNGLRPGEVAHEWPVAESIFTQPVEPNPETAISSVVTLESCHPSIHLCQGSSDQGGNHADQSDQGYNRPISDQFPVHTSQVKLRGSVI